MMIRPDHNKKLNPSNMKTLEFSFDVNSITKSADGKVTIEGMANTIDKDRGDEIVLATAFEKSLPGFMDNPVLLFQHDWDKVIGKVVKAEIRENGLWIKAEISNAKDVDDVRTKINEGSLRTFSIGYNEIDAVFDEKSKTKVIKELELLEISVVTIPMNAKATFMVSIPEGDSAGKSAVVIGDHSMIPQVIEFLKNLQKEGNEMKNEPNKKGEGDPGEAQGSADPGQAGEGEGEVQKTDAEKTLEALGAIAEGMKVLTEQMGKVSSQLDALGSKAGHDDDDCPEDGKAGHINPEEEDEEAKRGKPPHEDEDEEMKAARQTIDKMTEDQALEELEKVTKELEMLEDAA